METSTLQHRSRRAQPPSFSIMLASRAQPVLGVVDGLVSVTQRAWGLASLQSHPVH